MPDTPDAGPNRTSEEAPEKEAPRQGLRENAAAASEAPPVTQLLDQLSAGDPSAAEQLLPLIYDRLRRLAHYQRRSWQNDTLNTTALVHEAYLKLVDDGDPGWENRAHFFGVAATAMRHILVDYARHKNAQKRGGDRQRVPMTLASPSTEPRAAEVLSLDRALQHLEEMSPRQGRVVECRFFAGMTIEETAAALDVSPSTVQRDWSAARAWLYRTMKSDDA